MKPLIIGALIFFTSCTKNLILEKPVSVEEFKALMDGKTFHVTAYYRADGAIPYPENTQEDVYSFGEVLGVIDSKEPCIEYTVPLKIYTTGNEVMMDWVNLVVQYETFSVKEIGVDYFVLKGHDHSIRYTNLP